ncbi:acyl-CoA N-acyltransferase [Tirmania nivea]|nr:acyl-CoA N-acyltransferase [Tirmania nivea]
MNHEDALPDEAHHTLTFQHIASIEQNSEWTVLTSFKPPYTGFNDILTVKISSSSVESSLKEYMKSLWCTLYWYFQLPRSPSAIGAKPGAPKKEWKVEIRGAEENKTEVYEAERMGLIYNSYTCARRGQTETFYIYSKSFWQIPPDTFYQQSADSDNIYAIYPHPLQFSLPTTNGRHPLRPKPPAPGTTFYKRYIPSLNSFLTFRTANLETDVPILHKWMNNPRVDAFWGEAGPETHQHEFLKKGLEDNHCFPVIGSWRAFGEEVPFGYFEIYWVKEDRLAGYTETADWDRGVHVLVGEEKFRGSHRVNVWLSSLVHYMFLSDPRTMTLMLEPRVDNEKFISYLTKAGFYKEREFAFPHKQAAVMKLQRDAWDGPAC